MQKQDFETYQKRLWDFRILPKFSETDVFRGTIRHPYNAYNFEPERFCFGTLPLLGGGGEIKGWTQSWWRVESWVILTLYTFHCFLLLGFFWRNNAKYALQSNMRMIKKKKNKTRQREEFRHLMTGYCQLVTQLSFNPTRQGLTWQPHQVLQGSKRHVFLLAPMLGPLIMTQLIASTENHLTIRHLLF